MISMNIEKLAIIIFFKSKWVTGGPSISLYPILKRARSMANMYFVIEYTPCIDIKVSIFCSLYNMLSLKVCDDFWGAYFYDRCRELSLQDTVIMVCVSPSL
jgi:hypothetical protein